MSEQNFLRGMGRGQGSRRTPGEVAAAAFVEAFIAAHGIITSGRRASFRVNIRVIDLPRIQGRGRGRGLQIPEPISEEPASSPLERSTQEDNNGDGNNSGPSFSPEPALETQVVDYAAVGRAMGRGRGWGIRPIPVVVNRIEYPPLKRFEIWPEYLVGVDEMQCGILHGLSPSLKFSQDSVLKALNQYRRDYPMVWKEKFSRDAIDEVVKVNYNGLLYAITEIAWDKTPETTFEWNGNLINFVEYFKKQHGITIEDMNQPLLLSTIKPTKIAEDIEINRMCLVPELCNFHGYASFEENDFSSFAEESEECASTKETNAKGEC